MQSHAVNQGMIVEEDRMHIWQRQYEQGVHMALEVTQISWDQGAHSAHIQDPAWLD